MFDTDFMLNLLICTLVFLILKSIGNKRREKKRLKELPIREYEKKIINSINRFNGRDFELFMGFIFEQLGYNSFVSQATRDGGKDIVLKNKGEKIYVECKRYASANKIGSTLIQKLVGASIGDGVSKCYFVTTSDFTDDAKNYAKSCRNVDVELFNLDDILELCNKCDHNAVARWLGYKVEYCV